MSGAPATPGWADVLALVERLDASGLAEAEVVVPGLSVRVSRTVLDAPPVPAPAPPAPAPPAPAPPAPAPAADAPPAPVPAAPAAHDGPVVTAPMLGVLYHRPAPDAEPFVRVGDRVEPDTTVAIIEVMKLMNPVTAGVGGVVVEICVPDAAMVEHGDVLLRLRADG